MANNLSGNEPKRRGPKSLYPYAWGTGHTAYVGTFEAYSVELINRTELEIGDKIILPESAMVAITKLRLPFPLIFEIRRTKTKAANSRRSSHGSINSTNNGANQNKRDAEDIVDGYRRRLTDIYRMKNPSKIGSIDTWLLKHRDNPHKLYCDICRKYGIIPKPAIKHKKSKSKNNGTNPQQKKLRKMKAKQYCSVIEFSSPDRKACYLPNWMMCNLGVNNGDTVELQSQFDVPKGTCVVLQPKSKDFLEMIESIGTKEVFENTLEKYSALSENERIVIEFNNCLFDVYVTKCEPKSVICILGTTDLEVQFDHTMANCDSEQTQNTQSSMNTQNTVTDSLQSLRTNQHNSSSEYEVDTSVDIKDNNNGLIIPKGGSDTNNNSNSDDKLTAQMNTAFLDKLGVPLLFDEQETLARQLLNESKENHNKNDDDSDNGNGKDGCSVTGSPKRTFSNESSNANSDNEEEKAEMIDDGKISPPGPDDVQCTNCQRWIASMSFTIHEIHCARQYIKCKVCDKMIHRGKEAENEHFVEYHKTMECICGESFDGSKCLEKHGTNDCVFRKVVCIYCKIELTAIDYDNHLDKCKCEMTECLQCKQKCQRQNLGKHDCGSQCPLCRIYVSSNDLILHLVSSCKERRAICPYCKVLRKTDNGMSEHIHYCGGRSQQCDTCSQYVTLANTKKHNDSNCTLFSNKQLSNSQKAKSKTKAKTKRNGHSDQNMSDITGIMNGLSLNDEIAANPYLDGDLLDNTALSSTLAKFASNEASPHSNNDANNDRHNHGRSNNVSNKNLNVGTLSSMVPSPSPPLIYCPHCYERDHFCKDIEEFQIHIVTNHPSKVDDPLTVAVFKEVQAAHAAITNAVNKLGNDNHTSDDCNDEDALCQTVSNVIDSNTPLPRDANEKQFNRKCENRKPRSQMNESSESSNYNSVDNSSELSVVGTNSISKPKSKNIAKRKTSLSKSQGSNGKQGGKPGKNRSKTQTWVCNKCTLRNTSAKRFCQVCNAKRPRKVDDAMKSTKFRN